MAVEPQMEFQIGGEWVDVTGDLRTADGGITHTRGRREGGARVDPSAAAFTVSSPGGKYSNRNPRSPYYGRLGRNTPARLTVAGGTPHLRVTGSSTIPASTPDVAALDITGSLDVRCEVQLTNVWAAAGTILAGKYIPATNQRSWLLYVGGQRELILLASATGLTNTQFGSTEPIPVTPSGRVALRSTYNVVTGMFTHYTAPSMAGPWTELGLAGSGPTTGVFNSTAPVTIGGVDGLASLARAEGAVLAFQLRDGIDGPAVADVDFTDQALGATSFTDTAGRMWAVGGDAEITDRWPRFVLGVPEWPPAWHVSGHDVTAGLSAAGTLRRLGQGQKALASTLRRRIPSYGPLAYWPLEDEGGLQAASAVAGVPDMIVTQFDWGQETSLPSSSPLPAIASTDGVCTMRGNVPAPGTALTEWAVHWLYKLDTAPTVLHTTMRILAEGGTVREWFIQTRDTQTRVFGVALDGSTVFTQDIATGSYLFGQWVRVEFSARQNGGNVDWHIGWVDIDGSRLGIDFSFAGTVGRPSAVVSPNAGFGVALSGMALGHISVWGTASTLAYEGAITAWAGETAGDRIERLAAEEGVPVVVAGTPETQMLMGPQLPAPLLELLGECEASDGGILYEDRAGLGLRYRDRDSLYNQAPKLTIPYSQLAPPLTPVDDDRHVRNDRTVQRAGGSSARAIVTAGPLSVQDPPTGVGLYDDSTTLSLYDDTPLADIAGWLAHLGTWDEARYPSVRLYLHKYPDLIADVLELDVGDTIRITDLPDHLPPGPLDLMVMGYQDQIGPLTWDVTLFCEPAGPWTVAVLDSARLDTESSELAADVTATGTTFSIAALDGILWATSAVYPSDFPFDLMVGGERVTITALTGTAVPQTATGVIRGVNGVQLAHPAGTPVSLADPTIIAL